LDSCRFSFFLSDLLFLKTPYVIFFLSFAISGIHGRILNVYVGHVEPGEDFTQGAIRECKEEAGIDIVLKGILKIQHSPHRLGGGVNISSFYYKQNLSDLTKPNQTNTNQTTVAK
jgi:hypothetical protein